VYLRALHLGLGVGMVKICMFVKCNALMGKQVVNTQISVIALELNAIIVGTKTAQIQINAILMLHLLFASLAVQKTVLPAKHVLIQLHLPVGTVVEPINVFPLFFVLIPPLLHALSLVPHQIVFCLTDVLALHVCKLVDHQLAHTQNNV
jgi:hypothetical protein